MRKWFYSLLAMTTVIIFTNCQKEAIEKNTTTSTATNSATNMIVLGEKIENPYSVTNMRKALRDLSSQGLLKVSSEVDTSVIQTTDLYVRFLPEDTAQLIS